MPTSYRRAVMSITFAVLFGFTAVADAAQAMITTGQYAIPMQVISIKNMSAIKTVEARNIQSIPKKASFKIKGSAVCPNGSDLKDIQVMLGKAISHGSGPPELIFTSQPKTIPNAGYGTLSTNFEYTYEPNIAVNNQQIAVSLQKLNPARTFENMRIQYQNNGGNVVQFLREDRTFDIAPTLTLSVECEDKNTQAKSYGLHETSGKITVMYHGDPAIMGGVAAEQGHIKGYQPTPPPPTPGYQPATQSPTPAPLPIRATRPTRPTRQ